MVNSHGSLTASGRLNSPARSTSITGSATVALVKYCPRPANSASGKSGATVAATSDWPSSGNCGKICNRAAALALSGVDELRTASTCSSQLVIGSGDVDELKGNGG